MYFFQIKFCLFKTSKVFLMCAERNIFGLQEGAPINFINVMKSGSLKAGSLLFSLIFGEMPGQGKLLD